MSKPLASVADSIDALDALLSAAIKDLRLDLDAAQKTRLLDYLDALLFWNKAYNLTAIRDPKEALIRHIVDCLAALPKFGALCQKPIETALDVGAGAGLPSVVFAIARPDWQVAAVDSNGKKIRFLRQIKSDLAIANLHPSASRIEHYHKLAQAIAPNGFDAITSRAFAGLVDFVSLCEPYLSPLGVFSAMKAKPPTADEWQSLAAAKRTQHAWRGHVDALIVPRLDEERCLVQLARQT